MARRRRPSLFKDSNEPRKRINNLSNKLVSSTLDAAQSAISKSSNNMTVKRMPKYLEVTEQRMEQLGVIDLKKYYSRSAKKKMKKGGGWYLRVPMRKTTGNMSKRMYKQLRETDISPNYRQTVVSSYLYDRRQSSQASLLNYNPQSRNIEKKRIGNNRHSYTVYRTVSDKSPANSWIINRSKINTEDTSKTFVQNVNRLMKWKMKNGWQ